MELVPSDLDVVDVDGLQTLGRKSKNAGCALFVGIFMFHFNGPSCRLRLTPEPGLGADDAGTVGGNVHTALKSVPFFCGPLEWHTLFHTFMIGTHLEFLLITNQCDEVPLVHDSNVTH